MEWGGTTFHSVKNWIKWRKRSQWAQSRHLPLMWRRPCFHGVAAFRGFNLKVADQFKVSGRRLAWFPGLASLLLDKKGFHKTHRQQTSPAAPTFQAFLTQIRLAWFYCLLKSPGCCIFLFLALVTQDGFLRSRPSYTKQFSGLRGEEKSRGWKKKCAFISR